MPRAEREQLILDIAGQVFAADGYHSASMDEIARLAGVSKPMLYTYFGSKEGLYVAYIERTGQELVERMQDALTGDPAPTQRVRARVDDFLDFVEQYQHGWKVLFHEASASRPVAEEVAELRSRITDAVRRLFQADLAGRANLDDTAADIIAHAVVGAGESLANWWLAHPAAPRDHVADGYAAVIQGAVQAAMRERSAG